MNKAELIKLNKNMGKAEYEMYQDIEDINFRSSNPILNKSYKEYKNIISDFIKEETELNPKINSTTNRYILYIDDVPIGEFGIRTTFNDFWINSGSQIFYKIRKSEYGKGYGNIILKLGLMECKKLGMKQVRVNCDDKNIPSKKMILRAGGKVDKHYKAAYGDATSYIIKLN